MVRRRRRHRPVAPEYDAPGVPWPVLEEAAARGFRSALLSGPHRRSHRPILPMFMEELFWAAPGIGLARSSMPALALGGHQASRARTDAAVGARMFRHAWRPETRPRWRSRARGAAATSAIYAPRRDATVPPGCRLDHRRHKMWIGNAASPTQSSTPSSTKNWVTAVRRRCSSCPAAPRPRTGAQTRQAGLPRLTPPSSVSTAFGSRQGNLLGVDKLEPSWRSAREMTAPASPLAPSEQTRPMRRAGTRIAVPHWNT